MPPYQEAFAKGSKVHVVARSRLEEFQGNWKWHHPLVHEQLECADGVFEVKSIGFYHGGDVLYQLEGAPGIWHETCLTAAEQKEA